jgi:hypothetical protein
MGEHSIEELKRQRDNAKSKHQQSALDLAVAEKRLHDALCRESGLLGKIAVLHNGKKIIIHDVKFIGKKASRVKGFALKKDGTVGYAELATYAPFTIEERV